MEILTYYRPIYVYIPTLFVHLILALKHMPVKLKLLQRSTFRVRVHYPSARIIDLSKQLSSARYVRRGSKAVGPEPFFFSTNIRARL